MPLSLDGFILASSYFIIMDRDLYPELMRWKVSSRRKPLLLRGARQTGKTFLLQEFGRNEYESIVYCNFEKDPKLAHFFKRDLDPIGFWLNLLFTPAERYDRAWILSFLTKYKCLTRRLTR